MRTARRVACTWTSPSWASSSVVTVKFSASALKDVRVTEVMRTHPNTIRYWLDKVRQLTGLDHRVAEDLVVLCARLLGGRTWNTRARHPAVG